MNDTTMGAIPDADGTESSLPRGGLLILGGGIYSAVAEEIAREMGCFSSISVLDDGRRETPLGTPVAGKLQDAATGAAEYSYFAVAIGDPETRLTLLRDVGERTALRPVSLISPRAFVSPSAQMGDGSVVEPMAVIHALCRVGEGCLISAGAVVNHGAVLEAGVHVDCNATVAGLATVPRGTKVAAGAVFCPAHS